MGDNPVQQTEGRKKMEKDILYKNWDQEEPCGFGKKRRGKREI